MSNDEEEFSTADRKRKARFDACMREQGYIKTVHGFWIAPGATIETGGSGADIIEDEDQC